MAVPAGDWYVVEGIWIFGGYKSRSDMPGLVDMYMDGKLRLDEYITHRMSLEQINKGFDLLHSGQCLRTVIYM